MNAENGKDLAEALACGFTFLTGTALLAGVVKRKWKRKTDALVIVFTLLTGTSLYSQWLLGREAARENKRHADEEVNRTEAALEKQNELAASQRLALEQEIADGKKTQEVANKELAAQQAKTAAIAQALLDAQKQAAAAAAAAPPASSGGGGG